MGGWLRLYTEIRHDRKLRRLPPGQRWLWVVIMAIAKESPRTGWLLLSEDVPVTIDDLADEAAIPLVEVEDGINSFIEQKMLENIDGKWHLLNWDKRQFLSDNSTERSRKHRQVKNETLQKRCKDVPETPPEYRVQSTDTELKDIKDLFVESGFSEPEDKPSNETDFNFPEEYWDMVQNINSLPENKQLDMLVVQYGKKYPGERKKYFPAGVVKARTEFKKVMDLNIYPSEILKEILFETLDEGEKEPAPWDVTNKLIANRGLEQTRAQMNHQMAYQLERRVKEHGQQRDPPEH